MATSLSTLSTVLATLSSSGLNLSSLVGGHTQTQAAIEAAIGEIMAQPSNADLVKATATRIGQLIGTTNAAAAGYADALLVNAANPTMVIGLCGQLQASILSQSSGILSMLGSLGL